MNFSKTLTLCFLPFVILTEALGQSISPNETTVFCPGSTVTFDVVIPNAASVSSVNGVSDPFPAEIIDPPFNQRNINGDLYFSFRGRFYDDNKTQAFRVTYFIPGGGGSLGNVTFRFPKIKSFNNYAPQSLPQITSPINLLRCQSDTKSINFSNVQYMNVWESP